MRTRSPPPARTRSSQAPRSSRAASPTPTAPTSPRSAMPPRSRAARQPDRMIPRYSRPEAVAIWSPEARFRIWFEIEAYATEAMAELGQVPKDAAKKIWDKGKDAKFDIARIDAIE